MARYPGATWVGTPNYDKGQMLPRPQGVVFHRTAGLMPGCLNWMQNPRSKASAHFLNPHSGRLMQLVDTNDKAWAQAAGNRLWISVEHEGVVGDNTPTQSQIDNDADLLRWLHGVHGIPLQITDNINGSGVIGHCAGGGSWGGHPDCPGPQILASRAVVLARIGTNVKPPVPIPINPTPVDPGDEYSVEAIVAQLPTVQQGDNGQFVRIAQGLLIANGRGVVVDGAFGPATVNAMRDFQGATQLTVDGVCGPKTWRRLHCV